MSSQNRSLLIDNRNFLEDHDFSFLSSSPLVSHSHHYNLAFDQVLDDALGVESSAQVRMDSAYEACSQLLNGLINDLPPTTREERFALAAVLFASLGHGRLDYQIGNDGTGIVKGKNLHYGSLWARTRGGQHKRSSTADVFACGFIAATVEAAFGLPLGSISCRETSCVAKDGGEVCIFEVTISGKPLEAFGVTRDDVVSVAPDSFGALHEVLLCDASAEFFEYVLKETNGDKRGLIESFGVFLAHHMGNYYNACSNNMLQILQKDRPALLDIAKELLCECGHRDGYFTFGGILCSSEWQALSIERTGESIDVVNGCLAIARALGYGHWALEDYEPEKRLVLRSPSTYESAYHKVAYPDTDSSVCFAYQGAATAIMDLAHRVELDENTKLTEDGYRQLRNDMLWNVNETHCVSSGHDMCRIVVERR